MTCWTFLFEYGRYRKMELCFSSKPTLAVSIVLVSFNMARELPRTLKSLAPANQLSIDEDAYEVIVVDNGSTQPVDAESLLKINPRLKFFKFPNPSQSPVNALNFGISLASGKVVCACIDAARMASPRLLSTGLLATRLSPRAVVGTLAFHLGHKRQNTSVNKGYDQNSEDKLLSSVNWENNGYELFRISSFDPSSRLGYFSTPAETNALFMTREMWSEFGGFDPQFHSKGGGLANHDVWMRLCSNPKNDVILILGEGTFHQFHGGVATNSPINIWAELNEEYKRIRGEYYNQYPNVVPILFGRLNELSWAFFLRNGLERLSIMDLGRHICERILRRGFTLTRRLGRVLRRGLNRSRGRRWG